MRYRRKRFGLRRRIRRITRRGRRLIRGGYLF